MPGLDNYTKDIALNFVGNFTELERQLKEKSAEVQSLAEQMSELSKRYSEKSDQSKFEQMSMKFVKSSMSVIKTGFSSSIEEFSDSISFFSSTVKLFKNFFSGDFSSIIGMFVKGISSAFSQMSEMIEYSQMTNSEIRKMKLSYNLTDSEAYAMSTANEIMGFNGLEDMMWMNQQQWGIYRDITDRLEDVYLSAFDTNDLSEAMYEWQVNMEVLKIEFLKPFMSLISNNKGLIEKFINTTIDFLPKLVEFLDRLMEGKGIKYALGAFKSKDEDYEAVSKMNLSDYQTGYTSIAQSSMGNKYMSTYSTNTTEINNTYTVNNQNQELSNMQELVDIVRSEQVRQGKLADI